MHPVSEDITDCRQDVVNSFQPQHENRGIEKRTDTFVTASMVFGNTLFKPAPQLQDLVFFAENN